MTLEQALALIGVLFVTLVAVFSFYWRSFTKNQDDRFNRIERQIAVLDDLWRGSTQEAVSSRLKTLENSHHLLHEWKRVMFPRELENACKSTERLIERIERELREWLTRVDKKVNGDHK